MDLDFNLYMQDLVQNARNELTESGYTELRTPEDVNEHLNKEGTALVMVNSVCGCAGGIARPAAIHALNYDKRPDQLLTVFAGQDKEATETARDYFEVAGRDSEFPAGRSKEGSGGGIKRQIGNWRDNILLIHIR